MSNYFRTLLRFEKARASARDHQGDSAHEEEQPHGSRTENRRGADRRPHEPADGAGAASSPVETPAPERGAEVEATRRPLPPSPPPSRHDDWQDFRSPLVPPRRKARRRRPRSGKPSLRARLVGLFRRKKGDIESAESVLAHGRLLDSLRASDTRYSSPGVVLASAGGHASVRQVVDGLVRQARTMGVRIALAELVLEGDERVLRSREDDASMPTATKLELTGAGSDQILRDWFERATAGHDLLIVEGPPLTQSVDAALLARAGDGLSIVLEPRLTTREEFETAIERTRASGCFVLGLVMSHHQHWLPRFLRGFFNSYPKSIRTRPRRG